MGPKELSRTAKWVGNVPRDIATAQKAVEAGKRFFTADNIGKLVYLGADEKSLAHMIDDLLQRPSLAIAPAVA
ncbi:hypothetical protein D3C84_1199860 [compost metagenome]